MEFHQENFGELDGIGPTVEWSENFSEKTPKSYGPSSFFLLKGSYLGVNIQFSHTNGGSMGFTQESLCFFL
jgi:hypothetical protein